MDHFLFSRSERPSGGTPGESTAVFGTQIKSGVPLPARRAALTFGVSTDVDFGFHRKGLLCEIGGRLLALAADVVDAGPILVRLAIGTVFRVIPAEVVAQDG